MREIEKERASERWERVAEKEGEIESGEREGRLKEMEGQRDYETRRFKIK